MPVSGSEKSFKYNYFLEEKLHWNLPLWKGENPKSWDRCLFYQRLFFPELYDSFLKTLVRRQIHVLFPLDSQLPFRTSASLLGEESHISSPNKRYLLWNRYKQADLRNLQKALLCFSSTFKKVFLIITELTDISESPIPPCLRGCNPMTNGTLNVFQGAVFFRHFLPLLAFPWSPKSLIFE